MRGKIRLSIVVPVYRSEKIIPMLVQRICDEMEKNSFSEKFELILVNDASPDNSWNVIEKLIEKYPFIKGISLRKNFGQHNATMAGLNQAEGDTIIIMDDDMQHPPEAIFAMIEALKEYDVCYTRYLNRQHANWKKIGSKFNDWAAYHLLGKPKGLYLSSFKAMKKEIASEVIKYSGPYAYIDGLILDVTRSITSIDVDHKARYAGEGNYNLRRSISLWLKMATSFSILPLRIASLIGLIISALSGIFIIFLMLQKIIYPEITAGWSSIMGAIFFIGGIQTLCIGMIGEYLGRTYLKLNGKPQFSINKYTWKNNNE